ncbi:hypothetical protein [Pseudonocardia sp. TRM90224]|uniref:hypothetical protein n=1 Tax=Pseudonocardia sp. TRM90224 TaxID=2812678 RepID=UPI001E2980F7|nr:hypothetical protein [Pseudonocardia sp. TRM90224]
MSTVQNCLRAAAAAILAVGLSAGVAVAPAQAAAPLKMKANLQIEKYRNDNSGRYELIINGFVSMSPEEARRYVAEGPRATLRVFGDDPSYDNLRGGPYFFDTNGGVGSIFARTGIGGIDIVSRLVVEPSMLNEDNGWYEGAGDEIFARLRFVAKNGQEVTVDTNVVKGEF